MKPSKCIVPKCGKPRKGRGLCSTHHRGVHRLVARGDVTWEQLEKRKKVLPRKPSLAQDWIDS